MLYRLAASTAAVPRASLTDLFWPHLADHDARRRLTRLLSALRQALPRPDLLHTTPHHVALNPQYVDVDLWTIDQLCRTPVDVRQLHYWKAAVNQYRGPFLWGVMVDQMPEWELWLLQAEQTWIERYLTLLRNLIDYFLIQAEFPAAIDYTQRYLAVDPTHEESHCLLIELYTACGQRTAALRQYEQCLTALAEWDLQPAPRTDAAFAAICATHPQVL